MSANIEAAARRLQGQLVATPLIGEVRLPGFVLPEGTRVKAECLQMGGTVMFRGYLHYLLRSLGSFKGIALGGSPRELFAQALAASLHRLPAFAVTDAEVPAPMRALIEGCGCELHVVAPGRAAGELGERAGRRGYKVMPGLEDEDVHDGVATLGLELAAQLPRDLGSVLVSPATLAGPIGAGLRAGARDVEVEGMDPDGADCEELRAAVAVGMRLVADPCGLAALWQMSRRVGGAPCCVVLAG